MAPAPKTRTVFEALGFVETELEAAAEADAEFDSAEVEGEEREEDDEVGVVIDDVDEALSEEAVPVVSEALAVADEANVVEVLTAEVPIAEVAPEDVVKLDRWRSSVMKVVDNQVVSVVLSYSS